MRVIRAIAMRETRAYFATPVGWLCMMGFVMVTGVFFALITTEFATQATRQQFNPYGAAQVNLTDWLIQPFFANTAVILLMLCPALSMRLFAEDRRSGALELLLSSPISSTQIVAGKYLGAMGFVTAMLLTTLPMTGILYWLGNPDTGVIAAAYLATFLLAASFMSVGMLTSAATESQVVALVLSFGLLLLLWVLSWTQGMGDLGDAVAALSMLSHLEKLSKGLLHLKDAVYFISFIGFFVFATTQRVEAYRWR
jgi:ABC-2 type transport system permease protein